EKGTQDRWAVPGITNFSHNYGAETAGIIAALMSGGGDGGEGAMFGGGGGGSLGGSGTGGAMSYLPNALSNVSKLFGGMGGGGNGGGQAQLSSFLPQSQQQPGQSPWMRPQFQNQSFTPWTQNIASMGM